ncbi:ABC transporter permease [Oceanobacillus chungangensis]|uniref:ABC transporter permease n=1 Tax=Oceanobacillus chungangensis TaxID=1229152 RepID=A0A3D8PUN4_9BACI|nr:ABC transporter permease [Oceanobacillus chungangensis]RDW19826.1 ABC transporter permease [Oceanobacillus chungangensis]
MIGIFQTKIRMFIRSPWVFVMMTAMSIGFALIIGGTGAYTAITIPVYSASEGIQNSVIGDILEDSDVYTFEWLSEKEVLNRLSNNKAEAGVALHEDDFQLIVGVETPTSKIIEQTIEGAYAKKAQFEQIVDASDAATVAEREAILDELQVSIESPVFTIESSSFRGTDAFIYDNTFQTLFGFTLFFVIYTIAYNVLPILVEKKEGIWDRVILSPVKKWEMYIANLLYSFLVGYLQIVIIFSVFRYIVGVDFQGRFIETLLLMSVYVFAIVSLSILLTAIVKTVAQFNAILPIVAVSSAMIGGAYWPIEIVESQFLLTLSKVNPITYGMEMLNGAVVYQYPLQELLFPISILFLMGVVFMGVGIHLMERRHI